VTVVIKPLKLGLVGTSVGNGHPYSWSAILNGYNKRLMNQCPYPMIPSYLEHEVIHSGALGATVTHIWTEDISKSIEIAACSGIPNICQDIDELLDSVDGVLHARDDYELHPKFVEIYVKSKKPCFIDKPLCLESETARSFFALDPQNAFIFTCSALLFSNKLRSALLRDNRTVEATGPKDWAKYAIHLIEPSLKLLNNPLLIDFVNYSKDETCRIIKYYFEDGKAMEITTTGVADTPFSFVIDGELIFVDDYYFMFKQSLEMFIKFINTGMNPISRAHTLQVVSLLENGRK
jgi:hypothetical protein